MRKILLAVTAAAAALAFAAPLSAYVLSLARTNTGEIIRLRWKSTAFPITWRMNPVQGANITGSRTEAEVFNAAFASWQAVTTASVSFTQGPDTAPGAGRDLSDNVNLITTNTSPNDLPPGVHGLTFVAAYLGPGFDPGAQRTIEFAGQIAEADILFSATTPFTTSTAAVSGQTDLQVVATHEIGHMLGLDHSPLVSATMFWSMPAGSIYQRNISFDDAAAISILYPSPLFASKGRISGTVRTTSNAPVYGAVVVAVNSAGAPVGSAVTDPAGTYTIEGLDSGNYTIYAEPLDGPMTINNLSSYLQVYPGAQVNATFATRSR